MNILIVALDFKPNTGGIAEYTHQIARHLHLTGDKVTVLSRKMDKDKRFDLSCPYKVFRYDFSFLEDRWLISRWANFYRIVKRIAKNQSVDAIISNYLMSKPYICWLVAKFLKIPYYLFTYGLEINKKISLKGEIIKIISFYTASKVFCISSFTQSLVLKYGVSPYKTSVIPGGISIQDFKVNFNKLRSSVTKKFSLENKKVIFTLGRLIERKGQDTVIKALPRVLSRVPNAVYLIGGGGPYESNLKRLVREYNVEDRVIFAGLVDENERQAYYDACDIFIMPCRELENGDVEGFGIVFLEANACGKPVIVGRSGGAVEAVKNGETGLLVNPLSSDEVADAIIYLLQNPDIAKRMGKNGRRRVEEELTWEKIILKLRKEFNDSL